MKPDDDSNEAGPQGRAMRRVTRVVGGETMSRKLSKNEMIFLPFLVLILLIGTIVARLNFGISNSQIVSFLLPLTFLSIAIKRLLKKKKIDSKLLLNENEQKKESMLIWAGLSSLVVILFIGVALSLLDYHSKSGHEISLFHLILILIVFPLVVFMLYLMIREKIKKRPPGQQ